MSRVTDEERNTLRKLYEEGKGRNEIARLMERSPGIVSKIASEMKLSFDRSHTKKATEAQKDYAKAERLNLLNKGFDKADELLKSIKEAKELQAWMVAVATGIDKRRLEDGEATERREQLDPERRRRIQDGLDELARHRRERDADRARRSNAV